MDIPTRRQNLAKTIEASTSDLTVNHLPYTTWLRDNLDDVIRNDVYIQLDEIVALDGWHDAVTLAIKWTTGAGYGMGAPWQEMIYSMRNRAAREWLRTHRADVRKTSKKSDDFLRDVLDAIIGK